MNTNYAAWFVWYARQHEARRAAGGKGAVTLLRRVAQPPTWVDSQFCLGEDLSLCLLAPHLAQRLVCEQLQEELG